MKSRSSARHPDMGFQIAPMIDVVFVIMLFFMVMAGDTKTEKELTMKLPGTPDHPDTIVRAEPDQITIAVGADGALALNDSPVAASALAVEVSLLKENAGRSGTPLLVTVTAEDTASFERVAGVLDALALAGTANVTFALADTE